MDFPERLDAFFKATGIKKNDLPEKLGVSRTMLFAYLAGNNEPPGTFFQSIKKAFPWVNIEWLITGIGEMKSPLVVEESTGYSKTATPVDAISEKILLTLREMPEEKRREVLKYAEEQKLLAEFLAQKGRGRKANGEPD